MSGITLYSGISFGDGVIPYGVPVLPPPTPSNTITVGKDTVDSYGANKTVTDFQIVGDINSDYLLMVYYQRSGYGNTTSIIVNPGSYSGFNVDSSNAIDGDTTGDPRTFTINGVNQQLIYGGFYGTYGSYVRPGDDFNLEANWGNVLPAIYDTGAQPYYASNTMYVDYSEGKWGANKYTANYEPVFGVLKSSYFHSIYYFEQYGQRKTVIRMKDGTYTGFTVSSGAISSDTNGSKRKFRISGALGELTYSSSTHTYEAPNNDTFGLIGSLHTSVSVIYDPADNTGSAPSFSNTVNYIQGTDYSGMGAMIFGGGGPALYVNPGEWSNSIGLTALLALPTGGKIIAVVGGVSSNLTLQTPLTDNGFGAYFAPIDETVSVSGTPSSMEFVSPKQYSLYSPYLGYWGTYGPGGQYKVALHVQPGSAAEYFISNAQIGSNFVVTQSGWPNKTLTLSSTFTTSSGGGFTYCQATVTEANPYAGGAYNQLETIII